MQLIIRRDQRAGMLGKVVFSLDVRAQLTDLDRAYIQKYRLGDTQLYSSHVITDRGAGLIGVASRLANKFVILTISVKDLAEGKRVEAKDIVEMLAIEEQIKEAAMTFGQVLAAASTFGGEEVIPI